MPEPPVLDQRAPVNGDGPGWLAEDPTVPLSYPAYSTGRPAPAAAYPQPPGQPEPAGYPQPSGQPEPAGYPQPAGYPEPGENPWLPPIVQLPGPSTAAAEPAPAAHRGPARVRLGLTILAAVLGVAGLVASLAGVAVQVLPRKFSAAQQHQIVAWQVASRWRTWPAGKIFPATVGYTDPAAVFGAATSGLALSARRVGIAPQSSCPAATDPALARALGRRGCTAVLRATYTDATGTFVVTVGVAVLRGRAPAVSARPAGQGIDPGVRPVAFRGTLAARFGSRQRQLASAVGYGPYLVLYAAGFTDGRRRGQVSADPYIDGEMTRMASGIAAAIGVRLSAPPPPPKCPAAPGC